MRGLFGILCLLVTTTTLAFVPSSSKQQQQQHQRHPTTTLLRVVDSALLADGAVAVASFCAGVLVQVPRVAALEQNVTATRAAAAAEIAQLQERLYALDLEYEQGTAALRDSFDAVRVDQLQRQKQKQASEFQFKLQVTVAQLQDEAARQLQEQKATLLAAQLAEQNAVDRQGEIMQLRLQQTALQQRNEKLANLLETAQEEIADLQRKDKNRFWAMFGLGQEEAKKKDSQS